MKHITTLLFCLFTLITSCIAEEGVTIFEKNLNSIEYGEVRVTITKSDSGAYILFQNQDKEHLVYKKLVLPPTDLFYVDEWDELKVVLFDVNNDQKDDLVIGKYNESTAGPTAGISYLTDYELLIQSDKRFTTHKQQKRMNTFVRERTKSSNLNHIADLYVQAFNDLFNSFLEKFKPIEYPLTINYPNYNSNTISDLEVQNILQVDNIFDALDEPHYGAEYVLIGENHTAVVYARNAETPLGEESVLFIATFSKQGKLIDTQELGAYSDDHLLIPNYNSSTSSEIVIESNKISTVTIRRTKMIEYEGEKNIVVDSDETSADYSYENGIIRKIESKDNPKLNIQLALKFVNGYVKDCSSDNPLGVEGYVKELSVGLTQQFKDELKTILSEELDADPILNAQDIFESGYKLRESNALTGEVTLVSVFYKIVVHVKLIELDGKTLIDGCGIINMPKEEEFSVRGKFIDYYLGDASHFSFETELGEAIEFDGCVIDNLSFSRGLSEEETNYDNQGWGSNPELQGKWFKLTYVVRREQMYIDGPMGAVNIIIKAELDE